MMIYVHAKMIIVDDEVTCDPAALLTLMLSGWMLFARRLTIQCLHCVVMRWRVSWKVGCTAVPQVLRGVWVSLMQYVIEGSANINQRSMAGDRDTEIAMGSFQPNFKPQGRGVVRSHPFPTTLHTCSPIQSTTAFACRCVGLLKGEELS